MNWLLGIDHLTYVVRPDTIEYWAEVWEKLGGKRTLQVDDTNPKDKSSMMLWTFDFGEFGVALVAGIDREEKSHVTAYLEKHGDHSLQHVAFKVEDLEVFKAMAEGMGFSFLGDVLVRKDDRGLVKQIFGRGWHGENNPSEVGFPEFVERPQGEGEDFSKITFSKKAGTNLYRQSQEIMDADERISFIPIFSETSLEDSEE